MGTKTSMSVATFLKVAMNLPDEISVLIRGRHGIGKSQLVKKIAKDLGLPLIDRRLSQVSEGDMIGLPKLDGDVTRFCPPDWYVQACKNPCVLFLDELNRASTEVMQAAFQVVLDRELNGMKLHPKTRVFSAVNMGSEYTVNEMDPALLRRFWVIDLNPTPQEWVEGFARGYLDDLVTDFIAQNEKWLDPPEKADLSDVHCTRHSWERLDSTAKHMAKIQDPTAEFLDPTDPLFYHMCCGFVGVEAAIAFTDFAKNADRRITGADILNKYTTAKIRRKVQGLGQEKWNACIEKLNDELQKVEHFTATQMKNVKGFMADLPAELRVVMWGKLTSLKNAKNSVDLWKSCTEHVLECFDVKKDEKGVAVAPTVGDKKIPV